ncbi:MAG: hypothetical protein JW917_04250 [Ignavibacteria bacterium]|nr:hypothetical protein [Ignavibacteria bacterium]
MKKKKGKAKYRTPSKIFQKRETNIIDYKNENVEDEKKQPKIVTDKRKIDAAFADVYALMDMQDFKTQEDLAEFFEKYNRGEFADELKSIKRNQSPEKKAQNLIYKAFESESKSKRIKLAKQALKISDLCSDAYNLLAEEEAKTYEEKINLYNKGIEAGEKLTKIRNKNLPEGQMWSDFDSRPYLRSLNGLAMTYRDANYIEGSVDIHYKMLKLNNPDNQGVRYVLLFSLIALKRIDETKKLISEYYKDDSLEFLLAEFIIKAIENGYSDKTRRYFKRVFERNFFILKYLFAYNDFPKELPESYEQGDENEAILTAYNALPVFITYPKIHTLFFRYAMEEYLKIKPEDEKIKSLINDLKKLHEEGEELPLKMDLYRSEDSE